MRMVPFPCLRYANGLVLILFAVFLLSSVPAFSSTLWNWHYSGVGFNATGTLTTADNPDGSQHALIMSIQGTRNGEVITGLQPAGTSIPGNQPYVVDNLLALGAGPQLTANGFGFSTSDGNYSNVFYADFLPTPGYLEFLSRPPFGSADHTELPVQFSAVQASVPEPATFVLTIVPLLAALFCWRGKFSKFAGQGSR